MVAVRAISVEHTRLWALVHRYWRAMAAPGSMVGRPREPAVLSGRCPKEQGPCEVVYPIKVASFMRRSDTPVWLDLFEDLLPGNSFRAITLHFVEATIQFRFLGFTPWDLV